MALTKKIALHLDHDTWIKARDVAYNNGITLCQLIRESLAVALNLPKPLAPMPGPKPKRQLTDD